MASLGDSLPSMFSDSLRHSDVVACLFVSSDFYYIFYGCLVVSQPPGSYSTCVPHNGLPLGMFPLSYVCVSFIYCFFWNLLISGISVSSSVFFSVILGHVMLFAWVLFLYCFFLVFTFLPGFPMVWSLTDLFCLRSSLLQVATALPSCRSFSFRVYLNISCFSVIL